MLLLLLACAPEAPPFPGATPRELPGLEVCPRVWRYADGDGDGWGEDATRSLVCADLVGWVDEGGDCDDGDEAVHPEATEHCDGVDHDCDGATYEDGSREARHWYEDADGDGEGRRYLDTTCLALAGSVDNSSDCDDSRADVNTRAPEVCDPEGVDEDCDGLVNDEDTSASGGVAWWVDADDDGYGAADSGVHWSCEVPETGSANAEDCDDADAAHPGPVYVDRDGDGWGFEERWGCVSRPLLVAEGGDCADGDPAVNPGVRETDCESVVDLNCDGVVGAQDVDGDGVPNCQDCDETDPTVFGGAEERCNALDDDCDGAVDEDAVDATTWHRDADGDAYGSDTVTMRSCTGVAGWVAEGGDCDDSTRSRRPHATESCDGHDDDCDGEIDEDGASGCTETWVDNDGDGYGDGDYGTCACGLAGEGWSTEDGDCDDADPTVHPGWEDPAGGGDENCDGSEAVTFALGLPDLVGQAAATYLGHSLLSPGDLDGDGVPEVVLRSGRGAGGTVVGWSGAVEGTVRPADGLFYVAAPPVGSASLGAELASGADLDGDGLPELLVADPDRADAERGRYATVYVVPGSSRGALDLERTRHVWTEETASRLGVAVGLGAEGSSTLLAVGDPDDGEGAVWIYEALPRASGRAGPGATRLEGTGDSVALGGWLADPRDLDGDGVLDLVVGDEDAVGGGEVATFLGPFTGDLDAEDNDGYLRVSSTTSRYPLVLETAPDWDGDGYAELIVGTSQGLYVWGDVVGREYVDDAPLAVEVPEARDPSAAVIGPDVDGDGAADLVVGFPRMDGPGSESGVVLGLLGPAAGTLGADEAYVAVYGDAVNLQLPDTLSAAPGSDLVFVGASRDGTGASFAGAVWLLSPEQWR